MLQSSTPNVSSRRAGYVSNNSNGGSICHTRWKNAHQLPSRLESSKWHFLVSYISRFNMYSSLTNAPSIRPLPRPAKLGQGGANMVQPPIETAKYIEYIESSVGAKVCCGKAYSTPSYMPVKFSQIVCIGTGRDRDDMIIRISGARRAVLRLRYSGLLPRWSLLYYSSRVRHVARLESIHSINTISVPNPPYGTG
jgi:hypothetical protein